jgi:hypothetical protein
VKPGRGVFLHDEAQPAGGGYRIFTARFGGFREVALLAVSGKGGLCSASLLRHVGKLPDAMPIAKGWHDEG